VILSPFRKPACVLGVMAAMVPILWAGSPDAVPEPKVEMWIGLRRVDAPAQPVPAPRQSSQGAANSRIVEIHPVAEWAGGLGVGFIPIQLTAKTRTQFAKEDSPRSPNPIPAFRVPGPKKRYSLLSHMEKMLARTLADGFEKAVSHAEDLLVLSRDYPKAGMNPEEQEAAPLALKGSEPPMPLHGPVDVEPSPRPAPDALQSFMSTVLLPIAVIFAVAVVTSMVSIMWFFTLMRRHLVFQASDR
jgi:hypothetical protein